MKIFIKIVQITSVMVGLFVIITIVIPMILKIKPYIVLSGSMEPSIKTGAVAYVNTRVKPEEIREGDIISFNMEGIGVTHRVAKINDDGTFLTKGDANGITDSSKVTYENYKGKTVFSIPYLGYILDSVKTRTGICIIAAVIFLNIAFLFLEKYFD